MLWMIPVVLLLSAGSVLAAAYGRRAEEAMPITAGVSVLLLYAAYAADCLPIGYYAVLAVGAGCYILATFKMLYNIRNRGGQSFFQS